MNKLNYIKVNLCSFKRHDSESENANHSVGKILCNKCICRWLMSIIYFYNREKKKKPTGKLEKDLDGPFVKKDDQMVNKHIKRSSTLLAIKEMKSKS